MAKFTLSAVDQTVTWCDDSMTAAEVDAYELTMVFAQAIARAENPDSSSDEYFDALRNELTVLGWTITETRPETLPANGAGEPIDVIYESTSAKLGADKQIELKGLMCELSRADDALAEFVDFWRERSTADAHRTTLAIGPLTSVDGSPTVTLMHYRFANPSQSPPSRPGWIFARRNVVERQARSLTMHLDMARFEAERQHLETRTQGHVHASIRRVEVDW